ncbi:MAG: hypothetical protein P8R54_31760 [Myxococcota bacterium]|nr:hypothetical protein [Myxococcota bacterium]
MAPSLKAPGKNSPATAAEILVRVTDQLQRSDVNYSTEFIRGLLSLLGQLQPALLGTLLPTLLRHATPTGAALILSFQAESLAGQPEAALAALQQARATGPTDCQAWGAIARAEAALGLDPARSLKEAITTARAPASQLLLNDLLHLRELSSALQILQISDTPTPAALRRYSALCEALYSAERLAEILPIIQQHSDLRVQSQVLRIAAQAPLEACDLDAVFGIVAACPAAYRGDLLEALVLQWIDGGRIGAARRALQRWGETSPGSVIRLGMLAMLGDESAAGVLKAELTERLEVEEVAWHDTWRYQDLGRACGWAGDLGGTLSALERVVDHEDRMSALLSAVRYAPLTAREPLLCAARGLAASMQDDRHRAESIGHLAALQISMGRRRTGLAQLEEASRLAIAIRRPRSDQGFARRSALESVIAAQLRSGDHLGAFRTTRKLRTRHMRNPHLAAIARRYAELGDLGGVVCCLENMHPDANLLSAGVEALEAWTAAGRPHATTEAV